MDENIRKLVWDGYGLKLLGGSRTRSGFILKTDDGMKELKKSFRRGEDILFEYEAREYLYQNGFQNLSRIYRTVDGDVCASTGGNFYTLEEPLLMPPMEETGKNFEKGAKELARLHIASCGFTSSHGVFAGGNLVEVYDKRKKELQKVKKRIVRQKSYSTLDLLVRENAQVMGERILKGEEYLTLGDYQREMIRAEEACFLCHNAFKGENIRMDEQENIFVTGFGRCAIQTPMADLAAYIRRYMKKTEGLSQGAMVMVEAYDHVRPICKEEKYLLLGMLSYPEKFMKLINEYYNKRQVCVSTAMTERMESFILEGKKMEVFLQYLILTWGF